MCARINRFSFAVFEQLFQVFQEFNHKSRRCWLDAIQKLCCSLTKVQNWITKVFGFARSKLLK